jgi:hypothetical protein
LTAASNGLIGLTVDGIGNDGVAIDHRRSIPDFLARVSRPSANSLEKEGGSWRGGYPPGETAKSVTDLRFEA